MTDNLQQNQNVVVTQSGRIATVSDALREPQDYEVACNWLGWSLRHIDSDFSTLINDDQAFLVCIALGRARKRFKEGGS